MKEEDIQRAILSKEHIGWWEADTHRRMIRFSDTACRMMGFETAEMGFEAFGKRVAPAYRGYALSDLHVSNELMPRERIYPVSVGGVQTWLRFALLETVSLPGGGRSITGYVCPAPNPVVGQGTSRTDYIEDLSYRLSSISQTLLTLRHGDAVDEAIEKILRDVMTLFRGGRAYIIEFDPERRKHFCSYEVTADGVEPERDYINGFGMDELVWWTERMVNAQPVVLATLDELPPEAGKEYEVLKAQDVKSLMVMPLRSRDRVWGYAGIDVVEQERQWTDMDFQWFSSLINIITLCLDLRRSEQKAQEERAYLSSLYSHMPLGYVRLGVCYDDAGRAVDYRVLDSNYAADSLAQLDRSQYVGRLASELGVDTEKYLPKLLEVLRTGAYIDEEVRMEPGNHSIHAIFYTTRKDEVVCLFSDTTEVRNAHEALDRNEKLLRNIFDNIQIGVELYDRDGRMVDINNKDMEIFGVAEKSDALGLNLFDNPNVPLEIRRNLRAGQPQAFRLVYPFDRLNGYYKTNKTGYIEIFTTANMLYDMEGNVVNYMLINIDNTEINRAHSRIAEFESSFSLVSRFGKVGYCRFDLLTKEGYGVPQWYRNLGEKEDTPLREVIGVYAHVDPADRAAILEQISRVKENRIDFFALDLRINPGPEETWTRINVMRNPLNNDPSKIEMVCVNYDITELKCTERHLIEAKNKAEVSDRLKSAFLANMSHEIRTPLNAIVGFSNLLADTDDPEEKREYMRVVEENNDMLLKLISDILDLSKIEAGTFEFDYTTVDVNLLCEEAVRSLGLKVKGRPVALRFEGDKSPCFIHGDKNRLLQVITNFINNALKFTEKGSITLRCRKEGGDIRFEVADTGKGIPAGQQATVFDRFVKLNTFAQGTGLGLSISKSIVEQMGGAIGVESEEGRGSCFWFTVPVVTCEAPPEELRESKPRNAPGPALRAGKKPRVLVAEDTDSNFLLVQLLLSKEYEIVRAVDGKEAVRLCAECRPDAVLMDIRMPRMDGLEATRTIRRSGSAVPIIAVTAFAYDQDRQRAREAGCDACLVKPLAGDALRKCLQESLAGKP